MRFQRRDGTGYASLVDGVNQKTLVYGSRTLMVEFLLKKGSRLPVHSHPHEQTGYLVEGHIVITVGGERFDARPGDSWCIPGGTAHEATAEEESIAVEVFSPVREDYLPA